MHATGMDENAVGVFVLGVGGRVRKRKRERPGNDVVVGDETEGCRSLFKVVR